MKSNTIQIITNGAMTGTAVINSTPVPLDQIFGYAVQAIWTGTPNGTLKLQASCDAPLNTTQTSNGGPDAVTNWTDIADSSDMISGSAGSYMWNVDGAYYRYVRVVYVNTSSTGVLNVQITVKGI